jgi:methylmalonyl-CoA/ethylmalonyl-CoA epimerase
MPPGQEINCLLDHDRANSATRVSGIHHITILVRDIETAMARYGRSLGVAHFVEEELPHRGIKSARFRVGDTWLVLVQPIAEGVPMRTLERDGEGLFILSLGCSKEQARSIIGESEETDLQALGLRSGLQNWPIIDLDVELIGSDGLQLTLVDM